MMLCAAAAAAAAANQLITAKHPIPNHKQTVDIVDIVDIVDRKRVLKYLAN